MKSSCDKKNSLVLFASLLLIPIWGLGLLAIQTSNILTIFFTILLSSILHYRILSRRGNKVLAFSLVGPFLYIAFLFTAHLFYQPFEEFYTHPILWAFIIFLIPILLYRAKKRWPYLSMVVATSLYTFVIYPDSTYYNSWGKDESVEKQAIQTELNLKDYLFIKQSKQQQPLPLDKKFILLETWNETCPPCLKSIRNLQDTISNIKGLKNYYLYQQRGQQKLSVDSILHYGLIKNKNKIIVDPQNRLYDSLRLNAYPYFLLFSSEGDLIDSYKGYHKSIEQDLLNWLNQQVHTNKKESL